jgi:hypothetical protein
VTAKQQRLQSGLDNESDSESNADESVGGVSIDNEVELEQEYQFTTVVRVCESTSNLLLPEKDLNLFIREKLLL